MEYRSPRSFHLGAGELDDLAPFLGFVSDKPAETGWRTGRQHGPQIGKPGGDLGISERSIDVPVEPVDDLGGRVPRRAYAVMSFGGFLGLGNDYHPLPWNTLKYDTRQDGYIVGLTKQQLEAAPRFSRDDNPAWGNRAFEQSIHDYYRAPPYWAAS